MYKKLRLLTTMLLLAVCCGTWAEEVVYKTALFGSTHNEGNSSYTSSFEATNDGFVVIATNFNNNNNGWTNSSENGQIKCGRKNYASTGTITTKAAIDEAITKVVVTIDALTASKINSVKLYTSSNNTSWTEAGTFTKATGEQTVTLTTPTANLYYKLEFDCASGSSNGLITVSKVEYYYNNEGGDTPTPTVAAPTFSHESGAVAYNTEITISQADDCLITYTIDGSDPTIDSPLYGANTHIKITNITGETTIKAIAFDSQNNASAIASATYTVIHPNAPTFSPTAGTVEAGTEVSITAENNNYRIIYTTNGDEPSYNSNVGIVYDSPITIDAETTIKAIAVNIVDASKNIGIESPIASASYTIYDPNAPGTENNPYTVAQARAAIDAGSGTSNVYATGIVSEIVTAYNSQYGNITYNISADGTTTADQLEVYRGKSYNGDNFTSDDDIQVGDVVVVYGTLQKYGNTYEFAQDNQLVSLQRPVITTPSISLSENTINATADGAEGTINVTYTNFSDVIADVEFYEADGETTASYDWLEAEINTDNNLDYVIDSNSGEARTAYMKVYALDDDANEVYSELITISQAAYVEAINYTLASSITSGKHYIIVGSSTMADYAMGVQNNNNRAAVEIEISGETVTVASEDVHEVQICGPDANGFYTINDGGYLYAASSGSNYLRTEETLDDNGRWSITFGDEGVANIVAQGTNTRNTMQFNASNHIFACYASASQGDVYLYEKANEATPTQAVSISPVGLATFCSENALDFTGVTDVWAYIAKNENGNVTYQRVKKVPARTGVLLRNKLETGAINCDVPTLEGQAANVTGNKFIGTLTDINALPSDVPSDEGTNTNYILNNGANGVGFYKANGNKVGAGKAYLQLPTNAAAKTFIGFDEEGEATAISTIDNGQLTMDNVYNLQGQKVGSEYKGIVIVNGKKFINK